jgi:hypothetical protein
MNRRFDPLIRSELSGLNGVTPNNCSYKKVPILRRGDSGRSCQMRALRRDVGGGSAAVPL